ncbi:hypothetical protein [Arthrobacter sp. 35W]|uniref:hypothetical protein n=1 Tax=Arthrobacter sp. 35W TaxID=1132441 RepID=UPI0004208D08|nr:hypothetical protein [Arthrobacter sp. 35W]
MAQNSPGRGKAKPNPAVVIATEAAFDEQGKPKPAIQKALLNAVEVQRPLVLANLRRLRRKYPQATPYELSRKLEREFLTGVGGGGAAIGATAIIPGLGTVASLSISAAATVVFLEATALYAQSVAELHGIRLQDPERSRLAVMAIMLGEEGTAMLAGLTGHAMGTGRTPMQAWGTVLGKSLPMSAVKSISAKMQKAFLKKVAVHSGTAMLGRAIPFGIGAVIGGAGNYMLGRAVVAATNNAFGPAPMWLPAGLSAELDTLKVLPPLPKALTRRPKLPQAIESRMPGKKTDKPRK